MPEFRSKLEDIMEAEELRFDPTPGFGKYKPYLEHAVAHPAKMNCRLLEFLIKNFTRENETVLDPMCGSGSTGIVATLHGRNAIQVDIEEKFVKWADEAKRKLEASKLSKGWIKNICGDARRLSQLSKEVNVVVTSPPYSECEHDYEHGLKNLGPNFKGRKAWEQRKKMQVSGGNLGRLSHGEISAILTSPPFGDQQSPKRGGGNIGFVRPSKDGKIGTDEKDKCWFVSENAENIANLPLGNVAAILTSPPYCDGVNAPNDPRRRAERMEKAGYNPKTVVGGRARCGQIDWRYGDSEKNIGNLPLGPLSLFTSEKNKAAKGFLEGLPKNPKNIGNLSFKADTIITSPPYGEAQQGSGIAKRGYQGNKHSPTDFVGKRSYMPDKFENEENISRLPYEVDAVITSPPYARDKGGEKGMLTHDEKRKNDKTLYKTYGENPENIDNLPYGVDVIVTSPPYAESLANENPQRKEGYWKTSGGYQSKHGTEDYGKNENNIGNLRFADVVITSPPYAHESSAAKPTKLEKQGLFKMGHSNEEAYTDENYRAWEKHKGGNIGKRKLFIRIPCSKEEAQFHDTRKGRKGTIWEYTKEVEATATVIEKFQKLKSEGKGKSETYLEAMLQVYREMFKVLKPDGKAIIIIKPFIRNKKVVDLPWHTYLLLRKCGFHLARLYKLRLKQASFWRILYRQKFPEVPRINHEYVLIVAKSVAYAEIIRNKPVKVPNEIELTVERIREKRINKLARKISLMGKA